MAMDYSDSGQFAQLGKLALTYWQLYDLTRELSYDDGGSNLYHSLESLLEELIGQLNSTAEQRQIAASALASYRGWQASVDGAWQGELKTLADLWLEVIVAPALDLADAAPEAVLGQLAIDMRANSEVIVGNTVAAASPAAASHNAGSTAICVCDDDLEDDGDQRIRTQTVTVECIADAAHDNLTAGKETLEARGEPAEPNNGSGGSAILTIAHATAADEDDDYSRLNNGGFESITSNVPDDWTLDAGTAGTHVLAETTEHYKGAKCIELQGDGSEATIQISQDLAALSPALKGWTRYCVGVWIKTSGVTSGTITIQLEGTAYTSTHSIAIASAWPTAWTHYSFFEVLPKTVPAALKLVVKATGPLNDDGIVWLDSIGLVEAVEFPEAGIWLAAFQGAADAVAGDKPDRWTIACTSDDAGRFQTFLREKYLVTMPYSVSGSETIPDTLTQ